MSKQNTDFKQAQNLLSQYYNFLGQKEYVKGEMLLKQALVVLRNNHNPGRDRLVIQIKSELARLYAEELSRRREAQMLYRDALFFARQTLDAHDPLLALILHNLGCNYYHLHEFALSETHIGQAVVVLDITPCPDINSLKLYIKNHALTLANIGRTDEANALRQRLNSMP